MRKEALGILTGALIFMITGCSQDAKNIDVAWECDEGTYHLLLDANEWKVEENDDGTADFQYTDDEDFKFSVSKWEDLYFVEDMKLQYPEAKASGMDVRTIENVTIMEMGVQYEMLDKPYQMFADIVHGAECSDTLFFVSIYPLDGNEELDEKLDEIIASVQYN